MKPTAFDCDDILTDFLIDYLDDNLEEAEQESFKEYLSQNKEESEFVRKAERGKKVLSRYADQINISAITSKVLG